MQSRGKNFLPPDEDIRAFTIERAEVLFARAVMLKPSTLLLAQRTSACRASMDRAVAEPAVAGAHSPREFVGRWELAHSRMCGGTPPEFR